MTTCFNSFPVLPVAAILLLAACAPPVDARDDKVKSAICAELVKSREPQALLIDDAGNISRSGFDLGEFDLDQHVGGEEYIPAKRKFQLILSPARLTMDNECTMSTCVDVKHVTPMCKSTNQYEISLSLLPWKFGQGKFTYEPQLRIEDPKADFDILPKLHFKRIAYGAILMPWVDIQNAAASNASVDAMMAGTSDSAMFTLVNKGTRAITIGKWLSYDGKITDVTMDSGNCFNRRLQPNEVCQARLVRSGSAAAAQPAYQWNAVSPDNRYAISVLLARPVSGKATIHVENR